MNVIYNSDNYYVVEYSPQHGFELVDKQTQRGAFFQGDTANRFAQSLRDVVGEDSVSMDRVDEFLGGFDDWINQPVLLGELVTRTSLSALRARAALRRVCSFRSPVTSHASRSLASARAAPPAISALTAPQFLPARLSATVTFRLRGAWSAARRSVLATML
jgi:hypothetical protein